MEKLFYLVDEYLHVLQLHILNVNRTACNWGWIPILNPTKKRLCYFLLFGTEYIGWIICNIRRLIISCCYGYEYSSRCVNGMPWKHNTEKLRGVWWNWEKWESAKKLGIEKYDENVALCLQVSMCFFSISYELVRGRWILRFLLNFTINILCMAFFCIEFFGIFLWKILWKLFNRSNHFRTSQNFTNKNRSAS